MKSLKRSFAILLALILILPNLVVNVNAEIGEWIQGYSKVTQKIRNKKGAYLNVNLPKYEKIDGYLQSDGRVKITYWQENYKGSNRRIEGYIYRANINESLTEIIGYSKFDQWIRDDKGKKLGILPKGTKIEGITDGNRVYIKRYFDPIIGRKTIKGLIYRTNLLDKANGKWCYSKVNQWIRNENGKKLGILKKGAYVYGTFAEDKFGNNKLKISYKGIKGYIYDVNTHDYNLFIRVKGYTKATVNIRDRNGKKVTTVPKGTLIEGFLSQNYIAIQNTNSHYIYTDLVNIK